MEAVWAIGKATLREGVRNKVFYNLVLFGLLIIISSLILSRMTVGDETKIIKDLGLTSMALFGFLIALFVGSNLLYREFEQKIVYTVLVKPISCWHYLVGKLAGILGLILANVAIMFLVVLGILLVAGGDIFAGLWKAALLIFVELSVMAAISVFLTTFLRPTLGLFVAMAVYVIGHTTTEARELMAAKGGAFMKGFVEMAFYLFPNLDYFDVKTQVVHELAVPAAHILWALLYGFCYTALLVIFSVWILQRKEF